MSLAFLVSLELFCTYSVGGFGLLLTKKMAALFFCIGSVLDYKAGYIKLMHIIFIPTSIGMVFFISVGKLFLKIRHYAFD